MKSSKPRRLGILRTDEVRAEFQGAHGDYPEMFQRTLSAVNPDLEFAIYDARQSLPQQVDCDVYLITGSRHSVYDPLDWIGGLVEFVRRVLAAQRNIIGICFGHQLIAHYFGGEVAPAAQGWGVGIRRSTVVTRRPWMQPVDGESPPATVGLLCSHKDQVRKLPDGAQVFLSSDFCPVGGFTMGDQVITVQGHPEFSPEYAEALLRSRRDLVGEGVFATALDSFSDRLDAQLVVGWMLNFVQMHAARPPARAALNRRPDGLEDTSE